MAHTLCNSDFAVFILSVPRTLQTRSSIAFILHIVLHCKILLFKFYIARFSRLAESSFYIVLAHTLQNPPPVVFVLHMAHTMKINFHG